MSLVSINVDVSTAASTVNVTAAAGGEGTALSINDQTVAVTLSNVDGQPFEYKVGSGDWQQVSGRGSGHRIAVDLSTTSINLRLVWPGSTSVPVHVVAEVVSGALLASGATIASGGGGAVAFTDLTDAPSSYTGKWGSVLTANIDDTGTEFAGQLRADKTGGIVSIDDAIEPNNGAILDVYCTGTSDRTANKTAEARFDTYALPQPYAALALNLIAADNTYPSLLIEANPNLAEVGAEAEIKIAKAVGVFTMAGFDVVATDTTARLTVDAVEYSIAKAIKVKIGSDTYWWPLYGPSVA